MTIERVSTNFSGGQSTGSAFNAGSSATGRYVVYVSNGRDIVGGAGEAAGVYLRDTETGDVQRIDRAAGGGAVNGSAVSARVSGDGRYVTYVSSASNLVPSGQDDNGAPDVFVFDRVTGETVLVSAGQDGSSAGGASTASVISESGRYIAYVSQANDILPGGADANTADQSSDVYVYDQVTGETRLWSFTNTDGMGINQLHSVDEAGRPVYNATTWTTINGTRAYENWSYVGTARTAIGSVGIGGHFLTDSNGDYSVFASPPPNGTPYRHFLISASTPSGSLRLEDQRAGASQDIIYEVVMAARGRFVVYTSNFDVVNQENTEGLNLYLWDLDTDTVVTLAVASASFPMHNIQISADGSWITFNTYASYLESDTNDRSDIYRVANPFGSVPGGDEGDFPDGDHWIIGTVDADELTGTGADDHITALAGDDYVEGGDGNDAVFGQDGDDVLLGGAAGDELSGGAGADDLAGEDGDDLLAGDDGNDLLIGGAGHDLLEGGAGNDVLYGGSADLTAPDGDDDLYGGDGDDRLFGEGGTDRLNGGAGDDQLDGGDGGDLLHGGAGHDRLLGGAGDDMLEGDDYRSQAGNDWLEGGDGDDELYGDVKGGGFGGGDDTLLGGAGEDALYGGQGADRLYGEDDNDSLFGGFGVDLLLGGAGADLLEGGGEDDELFGDTGGETPEDGDDGLYGGTGNDRLFGNGGHDVLDGGEGDDLLVGGTGDDVMHGGEGADRLDGGEGADRLEGDAYEGQAGNDVLDGGDGDDVLFGDVEGGGFGGGDDVLTGGAGNDQITGGQGADRGYGDDGDDLLYGGFGDDLLMGGADDDLLEGGAGNDELHGDFGGDGDGDGDDALFGEDGDDVLAGNGGADLLVGGAGADVLNGHDGDDSLWAGEWGGSGGEALSGRALRGIVGLSSLGDILDGGAGDDTLHAAAGSRLIGGEGRDTFVFNATSEGATIADFEAGGPGGDTIDITSLLDSIFYGNDLETNPFATGNLRLEAREGGTAIVFDADGAGSDYAVVVEVGFIEGRAAADLTNAFSSSVYSTIVIDPRRTSVIEGTSDWKPETLIGTEVADTILGGGGEDIIWGREGDDDLMGNADNDELHGEGGNDLLQGGWGDDLLSGGDGDDVLIGGQGNDRIEGDAGQDTAKFNGVRTDYRVEEQADGTLRIFDLRPGSDGAVSLVSGVEIFVFRGQSFTLDELLGRETDPGNQAPVDLAMDTTSVAENAAPGATVGVASATDPDGDALTYSLVDDAGGRFGIDAATGRVYTTQAMDHEAFGSFDIVVRATDAGGLHTDRALTINIEDIDEGPTDLILQVEALVENAGAGALVGTAAAVDPEGGALVYSLVDDAGGLFQIDPASGEVRTTASLDHETASSHSIIVRATDAAGNHVDRQQTIAVSDVNEAPGSLDLDHAAIDENAVAGTVVGTVSATDPEDDAVTYVLLDDAEGRFKVDARTGVVTVTRPLDFEAVPVLQITVRATDAGGAHIDRTLDITVNDVNEAPTASNDGPVAVDEDATTGNLWSQLLENDLDPENGPLTIVSVETTGTRGTVVFDAATQSLRYVADADAFDQLADGAHTTDSFTYTVRDANGLTSTATVNLDIRGVADSRVIKGGNGKDVLTGADGEDVIFGGNGADTLYGLGGGDRLDGGNGVDRLYGGDGGDFLIGGAGDDFLDGGAGRDDLDGGSGSDELRGGAGDDVICGGSGNDRLWGGDGADVFEFGFNSGVDRVQDFEVGTDSLSFTDGARVLFHKVMDYDHDGRLDTVIVHSGGGVVVLEDAVHPTGPSMNEFIRSLWYGHGHHGVVFNLLDHLT